MKIILFILIFMQTLFVTSCCSKQKMIKITDNLTWVYVDEMNSYLLWNQKVIVGPGSITLKCDKMYAWGMLHEENISTFFLLNLKNGDFIKNPDQTEKCPQAHSSDCQQWKGSMRWYPNCPPPFKFVADCSIPKEKKKYVRNT